MNIDIHPLSESDLPGADYLFRVAFGTFLGLPRPQDFAGDADLVYSRWRADPTGALGAYLDGELVGSNFLTHWGTFGFFGPLTVRPDLWDRGIARRLLDPSVTLLLESGLQQIALFTFPASTKHVGLYQRYGFWPQHLTAVLAKSPVAQASGPVPTLLSDLPVAERAAMIEQCAGLTDRIFSGLDLRREIDAVGRQGLGETVLLQEYGILQGFAVCHMGPGSEAGSGNAYLKFAAASPGDNAALYFDRLLAGCEALAKARGLGQLTAGVNTARHRAYRCLLERGYRAVLQGVAMQRDNLPGFNRADCFVIDDWR